MTTLGSNIIVSLFASIHKNEWEEGLSLFDDGCIQKQTQEDLLLSATVKCLSEENDHKVSIKLHPSKNRLMWAECSCSLHKKRKSHCSHIVALILEISFFTPPLTKADVKEIPQVKNYLPKDIAESFLLAFEHGIEELSYNQGSDLFKIKIQLSRERKIEFHISSNILMKTFAQAKEHQKLYKILQKNNLSVPCGLKITVEDNEKVTLEKSIKIPKNKKAIHLKGKAQLKLLELTPNKQENFDNDFVLVPFSKLCINNEYSKAYMQKIGMLSITNSDQLVSLQDWPDKTLLLEDKAAAFFQEKSIVLGDNDFIWTNVKLDSLKIDKCLTVKKIIVFEAVDTQYIIDIELLTQNTTISLQDILKKGTGRKFYKNPESCWIKIPTWIQEFNWRTNNNGQIVASTLDLLKIKGTIDEGFELSGEETLINKIQNQIKATGTLNPPPSLAFSKMKLRSYQQEGYNWLWWLYQNKFNGLLADDMGLGKTHQAMALFSGIHIQKENLNIKHLVICPSTVLDHWYEKLRSYAPYLAPHIYHGQHRSLAQEKIEKSSCVVLTTYGIIMRDVEFLSQIKWETITLDEAHFVKNNKTAAYKAVCSLQSQFRLCLTGTPLENNLLELKTLFDFILPGYLGTKKSFRTKYLQAIESSCPKRETALKKIIGPFKMRRTKSQVLDDLPEKIEDLRYCHLTSEQQSLYQQILEKQGQPLIDKIKNSKANEALPNMHILSIIQNLKQLTNHPALIKKDKDYKKYSSGKFELLKQILTEAISSKNKVVIFSQFLGMIDIINEYCKEQQIEVVVLTGSTKNRGQVIKKFQTDPNTKVFIGSLLAGGMGIDLTAASVVIHYDRWWNPSKENQATDRAHRIGQKNCVQVFKLVTRNTLEERIDKLISKKSALFSRFLEGDKNQISWLNKEDILEILDQNKLKNL